MKKDYYDPFLMERKTQILDIGRRDGKNDFKSCTKRRRHPLGTAD
jgi:hypothetical protein